MSISLRMFSTKDWHTKVKAEQLLQLLGQYDSALLPDKYGVSGAPRFVRSRELMPEMFEFWSRKPELDGWYGVKKRPLDVRLWINWHYQEDKRLNQLNLWMDEKRYYKHKSTAWLLSLSKHLYIWGGMDWGQVWEEPISLGRVGPDLRFGMYSIKWANFFGPLYVEFFGRQRFETVPAFHKEELPDGGFLILTSEHPGEFGKAAVQELEIAIMNHLGKDAFFDLANRNKKCRVPEFNFQDMPKQRHATYMPAEDLVSTLIPDTEAFVRQAPVISDAFVTRLNGRLDYSPESLKRVDQYILRKSRDNSNFHETREGVRLFQELTAYYGEVLRRNLPGEWLVDLTGQQNVHPAIVYNISGRQQIEYPLVRVEKLWFEQVSADGLSIRYYLISSGQWKKAKDSINID